MKKWILLALFINTIHFIKAQCPTMEFIMVNDCGLTPGLNEEFMIVYSGGTGIEIDKFSIDFPGNIVGGGNEDIGIMNGCQFMTPPLIAPLTGCSNIIQVGHGDTIPPNALVVILTNGGGDASGYDWEPLCGSGQVIYLLQNECIRTAGCFADFTGTTPETRTTIISIGLCSDTITYFKNELASGMSSNPGNGDFVMPCDTTPNCLNGVEYGNEGCVAPTMSNFFTSAKNIKFTETEFAIYPNPGVDQLKIEWQKSSKFKLFIADLNGTILIEKQGNGSNQTIQIDNLASGIYVVKLLFKSGVMGIEKFVKI